MSQLLNTLSELLEAQRPILTADDLAAMGDDARYLLLGLGILVPAKPTTHVACDACHDDHIEEVARIKDGKGIVSFRIRCPDAGWVEVAEERLRQWAIDSGRLAATLATAIGSNGSLSELIRGGVWRIGAVEIAGESYEVVFVRNGSFAELLGDELRRKVAPARTIIIGTHDPAPEDGAGFAASLPLGLAFVVAEGRFDFQIERVRSFVAGQSVVAGNVFQLRGEFWQLSFDGKTTFLKDSVGLGYIAHVVGKRPRDVPAVLLVSIRSGIDPLAITGSSGPIHDSVAHEDYERRIRELQEDLWKARVNNDLGQIEKLEVEMEALTEEVTRAMGLGNRPREQTEVEKVRKAVSGAVSRDIERIAKHHEVLGRHLLLTIKTGRTLRYVPEGEIDWLT